MRNVIRKTAPAFALLWAFAAVYADGIAWLNSTDDALRQAKEGNKVVMVDLYTDW